MNRRIVQDIAEIAADTRSGSAELADNAADVLLRCSRTDTTATSEEFQQEILSTGWGLMRAQPTMAPLVNLVNAVLWSIKLNEPSHVNRRRVADVVREFKRRLHVHEAAIAETALPLIPEGALVVTHGRSTTVRAALLHAQRAGRHFRVVCAEGRPSLEGRTMTSELAAYGIPVTLMSDDLALAAIQTAQVVMIGADHLGLDGLVNKVGTYPVVETAYTKQVAAYALCSSEKFLPPAYHPPEHDDPALQHIWERVPAVPADNNGYFDSTPLGSLSGIVTERGVLPCEVIEGWLASIHLHPTLRTYQAISGGEC